MAALVGDMLLLASTDAGSWSVKRETVDMDTLLIETYELYEPVCRSSGSGCSWICRKRRCPI